MQNNYTIEMNKKTTTNTWEYHVISERLVHPDIGVYRTFGIHAFEVIGTHIRPAAVIHDITTIQTEAEHLAELCSRYQLSPIHLKDFIADYLAKIS